MTTKKTDNRMAVRHGDIVLHPISSVPVDKYPRVQGNALAVGSATGHTHRFEPAENAELYNENGGTMVLRVLKPVRLVHEEHRDIELAPGDWRVSHKRQYDADHGWSAVQD